MCAEEKKKEGYETSSAKAECCSDNFKGMFEGMKGCFGGEDKMSACCEKMKSMMSACCGIGAEGTSKKGSCS